MRDKTIAYVIPLSVGDDTPKRVRRICAYLAQHCDTATLASTAKVAGCHPSTVKKDLSLHVGTSFRSLSRYMRVRRAQALLGEGGLTVSQIARYCGYGDINGFYRAFEKETGYSPIAWHETEASALSQPTVPDGGSDVAAAGAVSS